VLNLDQQATKTNKTTTQGQFALPKLHVMDFEFSKIEVLHLRPT
jgi:hypothetical protein